LILLARGRRVADPPVHVDTQIEVDQPSDSSNPYAPSRVSTQVVSRSNGMGRVGLVLLLLVLLTIPVLAAMLTLSTTVVITPPVTTPAPPPPPQVTVEPAP
jgi:hypothetical protein